MLEVNRGCMRCHADVARDWNGSPHQLAYADPVFARALEREPLPMCRACHAPESDPDGPAPQPLAEFGVGCVSCHLSGDSVLAAPRAGAGAAVRAPHRLRREAAFASTAACRRCHEFPFPDAPLRARPEMMQTTVSEHARSGFAASACASCHMPRGPSGRRDHTFRWQRDEATLRAAIDVQAVRAGPAALRLVLTTRGVGHAFPTGDLFRRIEVSVDAVGDDYARVTGRTEYLARHFRPLGASGAPRRVIRDNRLGASGVECAELDVVLDDSARGLPLAWRVAYQRVEHPASVGAEDAVVESEVTLAQGIVPESAP